MLERLPIVVGLPIVLAGAVLLVLSWDGVLRVPGDILAWRCSLVVHVLVASALVLSGVLMLMPDLLFRK